MLKKQEEIEVEIRKMGLDELVVAFEWAKEEGWNPCQRDIEAIYEIDRDGYWGAWVKGEMVGCVSVVKYWKTYAFVGLLIVKNEYRGGVVGQKLIKLIEKLKEERGIKMMGCDGVEENIEKYEKFGFELAYMQVRFGYCVRGNEGGSEGFVEVMEEDWEKLNDFVGGFEIEKRRGFVGRWHEKGGAKGRICL